MTHVYTNCIYKNEHKLKTGSPKTAMVKAKTDQKQISF